MRSELLTLNLLTFKLTLLNGENPADNILQGLFLNFYNDQTGKVKEKI